MIKFSELDAKKILGIVVTLFAMIVLTYTNWSHIKPVSIAGTYLSVLEMSVSTIEVTEPEPGKLTCVWTSTETSDKGVIKDHNFTFQGKLDGKNLILSLTVPTAVPDRPIVIDATGLRDEPDIIRMSLRMNGKLFFTGKYERSNATAIFAATAQLRQRAGQLAQDWDHKLSLRDTGGQTPTDQARMSRGFVVQSNSYVKIMTDFVREHDTVIARYKSNTASINDYLANARRIPGPQNAMLRRQLLISMQQLADLTESQEENQLEVGKQYTNHIVPFFDNLSKQQQLCAQNHAKGINIKSEDDLCDLTTKLQKILVMQGAALQQAMDEVVASYTTEYAAQKAAIAQAQQIQ